MYSDPDIQELTRLFQEHYGYMFVIARRHAPSSEAILDIIQQVFIDFVQNAPKRQWDLEQTIAPLLGRMVRDRALELRRRERSRTPEVFEQLERRLMDLCERTDPNVVDRARDELEALKHCSEKLSRKSREYLRRHYEEGESMEKIARTEKLNPGSLRQTFSRIRIHLRLCIEKYIER